MKDGRSHENTHAASSSNQRTLAWVLAISLAFVLVEVAAGFAANSLALLADAGHMFTDAFGMGLSLAALVLSSRDTGSKHSFGFYRVEVLASTVNAALLLGATTYILYTAWTRLLQPQPLQPLLMMIVAAAGILVNGLGFKLLQGSRGHVLTVVRLELMADTLGAVGALLAGLVAYLTGWTLVDPLVSIAVALYIVPRTWRLLRSSVDILLQGVPKEYDLAAVRRSLAGLPGVEKVHDLHVWRLTDGYDILTCHLVIAPSSFQAGPARDLLEAVQERCRRDLGIQHTTVQIEPSDFQEDALHR